MRKLLLLLATVFSLLASAQQDVRIKKKDRKRDIEMVTTEGTMVLRLSDSTPEHRDNFIRLVKSHYLDSMLFHRVIKGFMIQSGDTTSIRAAARVPLGNGGPGYTLPAEMAPSLFHKKGALAAGRVIMSTRNGAAAAASFILCRDERLPMRSWIRLKWRGCRGEKFLPNEENITGPLAVRRNSIATIPSLAKWCVAWK
jgi:cyclophilin family peptidyl-prolyl cis-trans isomerase